MRENCTSGTVRGVPGNRHSYRREAGHLYMKKRLYWVVQGYDGLDKIYETQCLSGCFSTDQMEAALKALVSRAGLSFDEIFGSFAKKGTRLHLPHLEVHKSGPPLTLMCGSNPHFVARIVEA
jgi:hypothetical protein